MKILIAPTEDFIKESKTQIGPNGAIAGSAVAITVLNSQGFVANDYVVIGDFGSSQAEIQQITTVSGETITVGTLALNHRADEPMVKIRYNKRKFYGALVSGGTYTELAAYGSPIQLAVNNPQGTYLEYTGTEGYSYFKSTYFNSHDSAETDTADAVETQGDQSSRYCSIYDIKRQAGLLENPFVTDSVIESYRKRAENEVNSYLFQRYVIPLVNSVGQPETIPFVVENATMLLAAGYLDYQEYGAEGQGVKWLGEARGLLKSIQKGAQRLIDSLGAEFGQKTATQGIQGYPNNVDNQNGPPRYATMQQRF